MNYICLVLFTSMIASIFEAKPTVAQQQDKSTERLFQAQAEAVKSSSDTTSATMAQSGVNWTRIGIVGGGIATAFVALHIYQNNAWWASDRASFHVIEDPAYQADFDKFGHTFGAYYSSHFFNEAFLWSGLDSTGASLLGAFSGALYELYVEIEDGFAGKWGFSRGDAKSDILGATFYLLNQRVPFLQHFRYKWFYSPTNKLLKNQPDIPGQTVNFIEDYGGQTYYMSAHIYDMLPVNAQAYWPRWLNLAAGVSGYNINDPDYAQRRKAWYIALDYDLDKIIPETQSGFLNFLIRGLGYWHFPAPAWRFYPDKKFFWLFPLSFTFDHGFHLGAEPSLGGN